MASSASLICRPRPGWSVDGTGRRPVWGDFRRPGAGVATGRSTRKALSYAAGVQQDGDWRCGRSSAASGAAVRPRVPPPMQRNATCRYSRPFDDIGLHHAHSGLDQIGWPKECVGLLAGGNRDVEASRDLAHCSDVIMLHRLLGPPIAEFLTRPRSRYWSRKRAGNHHRPGAEPLAPWRCRRLCRRRARCGHCQKRIRWGSALSADTC